MPDADKIVEAEQSIQNIAAELTRMRDAANLLQDAQARSDEVIKMAQKVILAAGGFYNASRAIVAQLAETNLSQKLDSLHKLHDEVAGVKSELEKKLGATFEEMRNNIQSASASIATAVNEVGEQSQSYSEQLANLMEEQATAFNTEVAKVSAQLTELETAHGKERKGAKTRSIVIMIFVILGSFAALGSLATLLIRQGP